MKLSNKDKILLFVLVAAISIWGYYNFSAKPQHIRIVQLQQTKMQYDKDLITHEDFSTEKEELDQAYSSAINNLINIESNFFVGFDYGDVISIINKLTSTHGINLTSLEMGSRVKIDLGEDFQHTEDEFYSMEEDNLHTDIIDDSLVEEDVNEEQNNDRLFEEISVAIEFTDDFDTVMSLLKEIQTNDKLITIESFDMRANELNLVEVKLNLVFYGVCSIPDDQEYDKKPSEDILGTSNPFVYIEKHTYEEEWEQNDESKQTPTIEIGVNRVILSDFEKTAYIFARKNQNISGRISKDINSLSGDYSLRLEYDFSKAKEIKEVLTLFAEDIIIPLVDAQFAIWIYSPVEIEHSIDLIIVDSKSKEYRITIADTINWTGWQQKIIDFADEAIYPIRITAIAVSSEKLQDSDNSVLLFDKMELLY
ncbi:MAG: hypothetical protein ACLKAN_06710 [Alkaliphilus sp.]